MPRFSGCEYTYNKNETEEKTNDKKKKKKNRFYLICR
jgi:hypothetical protein